MKYEAVFGDQKRFNEQNNEMAEVMLWHDCLGPNFVSLKESSRMNSEGSIPHGSVVLAMRRIIAEPKRWTVEDQKAGRMPEVGSLVEWNDCGVKLKVTIESAFFNKSCAFSFEGRGIGIAEIFDLSPIETPEEKAQREEDEFVRSFFGYRDFDINRESNPFTEGLLAAYRKLKGGE